MGVQIQGCTYRTICLWRSEDNLQDSVLPPVGSEVIRLGSKQLTY